MNGQESVVYGQGNEIYCETCGNKFFNLLFRNSQKAGSTENSMATRTILSLCQVIALIFCITGVSLDEQTAETLDLLHDGQFFFSDITA